MRKRLLSLGLIMVLCFSLTGCKSSDYKKAVELQNSGDYAGALELFKGIGDDYKDVSDRATECQSFIDSITAFDEAKSLLDDKNAELDKAISEANDLVNGENTALDESLRSLLETKISETKAIKITAPTMAETVKEIDTQTTEMNTTDYSDALRDIDDIRNFLDEDSERTGIVNNVVYDRMAKGYRLETLYKIRLQNSEVLALCKILLDSRAFTKNEMVSMLDKLITCCVPKVNQKRVKELIQNEEFHYVEPKHGNEFIDLMWDLGQAINESRYIEIDYLRTKDKAIVHRRLQPVAIMFSEYYFYLTAFIEDEEVRKDFDVINDSFPTIYRIDRIKNMSVLDERFHIPYSSRFEEGEFRKRIQFMYGGKIQKVRFRYKGPDIDSILDRLPTAHVLDEENGEYIVAAEVFGTGINMWIRSQGDYIEMIEEV